MGIKNKDMIGAIIGDIVGSIYEFDNHKSKEFKFIQRESTFTDDTVMTIAVADFLLDRHGNPSKARFVDYMYRWYKKYPDESYGAAFKQWIMQFDKISFTNWEGYNSFGNGAAMRISPIGDVSYGTKQALDNAKWITEVSHNHPEGIKGAQAVASLIEMAGSEKSKPKLKKFIEDKFGYDLSPSVNKLRKTYVYNETCQKTVPEAIICFLKSKDFEDAIRNAISIGGDSDTLAAITGGIAEAYYMKIPMPIMRAAFKKLTPEMKLVVRKFYLNAPTRYTPIVYQLAQIK